MRVLRRCGLVGNSDDGRARRSRPWCEAAGRGAAERSPGPGSAPRMRHQRGAGPTDSCRYYRPRRWPPPRIEPVRPAQRRRDSSRVGRERRQEPGAPGVAVDRQSSGSMRRARQAISGLGGRVTPLPQPCRRSSARRVRARRHAGSRARALRHGLAAARSSRCRSATKTAGSTGPEPTT
jgi:hypothetical protein